MTEPSPQYSLTINFRGICTHFHHTVLPGVPHRVVLVDAASYRAGLATTAPNDPSKLSEYHLQPHLPTLHSPDVSFAQVSDLIEKGYIRSSVHLTVPNAVGYGVSYSPNFDQVVLSVTSFTDHYSYSADVVLAGRAAAYLDIHSGTITAAVNEQRVVHVSANIPTDGPPILRVAPLAEYRGENELFALSRDLTFPESNLNPVMTLSNSCWTGVEEETNDYLLHLLTDRGGIPRKVVQPKFEFVPQSPVAAAGMLRALLEDLGYPMSFDAGMGPPGTQESCSDSRYP